MEDGVLHIISVEVLDQSSIEKLCNVAMASTIALSWMDPIISYIINGSLLCKPKEAERVRRKSVRFLLSEEKRLYRRSFGGWYFYVYTPPNFMRGSCPAAGGIGGSFFCNRGNGVKQGPCNLKTLGGA